MHETGHDYMYNATGWWLWWDTSCYDHNLFTQEDLRCAWSEGWADFFPLVTNGDQCYDFLLGPCTGTVDRDFYNLETHSRNDNPGIFSWGDIVEGRVAGALYDIFDSTSDGFDSAAFGFDPISDIVFQGTVEDRFSVFWSSWLSSGQNKHHAVRAIYQNTIDYDTPPAYNPLLPDLIVLQNTPWVHAIDLWAYTSDTESADSELIYQLTGLSDSRCGVSLDGHWVNSSPQTGWLGNCDVTIQVSDSLKAASDTFRISVKPVAARLYLPFTGK